MEKFLTALLRIWPTILMTEDLLLRMKNPAMSQGTHWQRRRILVNYLPVGSENATSIMLRPVSKRSFIG